MFILPFFYIDIYIFSIYFYLYTKRESKHLFRLPFGGHGIAWKRLKIGPQVIAELNKIQYIHLAVLVRVLLVQRVWVCVEQLVYACMRCMKVCVEQLVYVVHGV